MPVSDHKKSKDHGQGKIDAKISTVSGKTLNPVYYIFLFLFLFFPINLFLISKTKTL
jgi:hypothetical protein